MKQTITNQRDRLSKNFWWNFTQELSEQWDFDSVLRRNKIFPKILCGYCTL